jgi:hypothetical protein
MTVHLCYCIGICVLSGLLQKQKRIQNHLENRFGKLEKKKKMVFPSFRGFWPIGPAGCSAPPRLLLLWPTRPFSIPQPSFTPRSSPRFGLGSSPATGPTSHARPCFFPLYLWLTIRPRTHVLLTTWARTLAISPLSSYTFPKFLTVESSSISTFHL